MIIITRRKIAVIQNYRRICEITSDDCADKRKYTILLPIRYNIIIMYLNVRWLRSLFQARHYNIVVDCYFDVA